MGSSSFTLPTIHRSPLLQQSHFLGQTHFSLPQKNPKTHSIVCLKLHAKFNLTEIMGGRGLCNGEQGLQLELKKTVDPQPSPDTSNETNPVPSETAGFSSIVENENAFEKELLGLTGGFPGGEKGLKKFIEKSRSSGKLSVGGTGLVIGGKAKVMPPELPLLMPGMIAIVKNPNNPYYMYCGIVQRITDGKAGVLFEGGNWDRLITFRLDELQRRDKGPPMVNPRSVVLEEMLEKEA